jgi:hypothetical protein
MLSLLIALITFISIIFIYIIVILSIFNMPLTIFKQRLLLELHLASCYTLIYYRSITNVPENRMRLGCLLCTCLSANFKL